MGDVTRFPGGKDSSKIKENAAGDGSAEADAAEKPAQETLPSASAEEVLSTAPETGADSEAAVVSLAGAREARDSSGDPVEDARIAVVREKIASLKAEHLELDRKIEDLSVSAVSLGSIAVQRLKKEKLALKERIRKLEAQLLPDIIA